MRQGVGLDPQIPEKPGGWQEAWVDGARSADVLTEGALMGWELSGSWEGRVESTAPIPSSRGLLGVPEPNLSPPRRKF